MVDKKSLLIHLLHKLQGRWNLAEGFLLILEKHAESFPEGNIAEGNVAEGNVAGDAQETDGALVDGLLEVIYQAMNHAQQFLSVEHIKKTLSALERIQQKEAQDLPTEEELDALLDGL